MFDRGGAIVEIISLAPGGFAANTYLVCEGEDAVLIDCSASVSAVREALGSKTLHAVLLTHGHFDHMLTADALREAFHVPLYLHEGDADYPADGEKNAYAIFFGMDRAYGAPSHTLHHGDTLTFGALTLSVSHVPGHTRGCVTYRAGDALFTGDTLFAAGVGRTDLYGGDTDKLLRSLQALQALPRSLRIYPGHGEDASLGAALDRLSFYM